MSAEESRPRLLRRFFPHRPLSDESSASRKTFFGHKSSNVIPEKKKPDDSALEANHSLGRKINSNGLWGEVYNSFTTSTTSPDLQVIAKLLRDESISYSPETASKYDADVTASREWRLCSEVLKMAESKRSELAYSGEKPLVRQMRHAYEEIITWTHKFVTLGDVISQVDPVHIGLPWAGIRAFLIVRTWLPLPLCRGLCALHPSLLSMIRKHMLRFLPELHISLG